MHIENGAKECKTFNALVICRQEGSNRGERDRLQLQLPGTRIYLTNSKKLLLPAKNPAGRAVSKGIAAQMEVGTEAEVGDEAAPGNGKWKKDIRYA